MTAPRFLALLMLISRLVTSAAHAASPGSGQDRAGLEQAAGKGDADAQYRLGLAILKDEADGKQNQRRALAWFVKAARQGHNAVG